MTGCKPYAKHIRVKSSLMDLMFPARWSTTSLCEERSSKSVLVTSARSRSYGWRRTGLLDFFLFFVCCCPDEEGGDVVVLWWLISYPPLFAVVVPANKLPPPPRKGDVANCLDNSCVFTLAVVVNCCACRLKLSLPEPSNALFRFCKTSNNSRSSFDANVDPPFTAPRLYAVPRPLLMLSCGFALL